ncbi:DUF6798 domain-containing protein [Sorangium sp. So ce1335]|uniref:DUF6798 domain-containing protein n=1 Tax=Sorangium sp. So ce1335 TaxID=3133335 RepID=UPI003F6035D7
MQPAPDDEQLNPDDERSTPDASRDARTDRYRAWARWSWVVPCLVFGAVASMWRPFVSNQNTYFAHAALRSGDYPQLAADWFAHTREPTLFFSWLMTPLLALGLFTLPVLNAVFGSLCMAAIVLAAESLLPADAPRAPRWVIACALGSAGLALPDMVFEGTAGQSLFRGYLQPSNAGVLLLCGLALSLRGRRCAGAAVASLSAILHPTYVPSVLLLVGAELLLDRETPARRKALAAALAGVLLMPPLLWAATQFAPSDAETFQKAQRILADSRIPHHSDPRRFLALADGARALVVVLAIVAATRSGKERLGVFAGFVVLGTLAAIGFPKLYSLRLAFPWRISTWLIPLSTAVLCAALFGRLTRRLPRVIPGAVGVVGVVAVGAAVSEGLDRMSDHEDRGIALAREAQRRGSATDVVVAPSTFKWSHLRLNAPVATFADWKSHPYADREVVEWNRRIKLLEAFYASRGQAQCRALEPIVASSPAPGWVIMPPRSSISCDGVELALKDRHGSLYRIDRPAQNQSVGQSSREGLRTRYRTSFESSRMYDTWYPLLFSVTAHELSGQLVLKSL